MAERPGKAYAAKTLDEPDGQHFRLVLCASWLLIPIAQWASERRSARPAARPGPSGTPRN